MSPVCFSPAKAPRECQLAKCARVDRCVHRASSHLRVEFRHPMDNLFCCCSTSLRNKEPSISFTWRSTKGRERRQGQSVLQGEKSRGAQLAPVLQKSSALPRAQRIEQGPLRSATGSNRDTKAYSIHSSHTCDFHQAAVNAVEVSNVLRCCCWQ